MIADYVRVARLYLVLLAIFTVGRFALAMNVSYEKAHHVFSIVTMTLMASVYYAAFCRRWRGWRLAQAVGLGVLFGFVAEVVILLATVASYALGADTFFNHPRALNVESPIPLGQALVVRARGLVVFPIANAIAAAIGWALGGLLPLAAEPVALPASIPASRTA
jgi:hypothetical protein